MKQYVGYRAFFKKFVAIALFLLIGQPTFSQSSQNQQMVFEGSLTDSSGNAINLSGTTLNFYITVNGCYLYGESSTIAGDSLGNIVHRFGSGSVLSGSPNSFSQNLFFGTATGTTTFAGNNCAATASDTRLAQVNYAAENITATIKLGTVPYAQNAVTLSGKAASDFILASIDSNTLFSGGSAGQYLTKSASGLAWTSSTITSAAVTSALGYTPSSSTVVLNNSTVTAAIGYLPASASSISALAVKANNLSDLTSATLARSNLGLGSLAIKNSVNLATEVSGVLSAVNLPAINADTITSGTLPEARLPNISNITSGTQYTKVTVDGKGRVTSGSQLSNIDIATALGYTPAASSAMVSSQWTTSGTTISYTAGNIGIGTTAPTAKLSVSGGVQISMEAATCAVSYAGTIRYNAGNVEYCNGTSWTALGVAGSGITSFNGSTSATQGFAINNTGTGFSISTINGLHTFRIPQASSASVTSGFISNADYTTFTNKITSSGASIAQVLGYIPANSTSVLSKVNNLSDLGSSATARANLGLGVLATKNAVNLASADVFGTLPVSNGGSPWVTHLNGYYMVSNTTIGSSAVLPNTKLFVEANSPSQVAKFSNTSTVGYGVRIDVAGSSAAQYALNVNNASGSIFVVQNDGNIGVGTLAPASVLNIVNDNGVATKDDIQINTFGSTNTAALALQKARGTAAAPTTLLANDNIGNLRWDGYTGSAYTNLVAISGFAETDLNTGVNSFVTISTNSNGTMAERVRVSSNGNVSIGTANATTAKLHVAGAVVSKPHVIGTGTAIDLSLSNMFILNSVGGTANSPINLALNNMTDGGTYSLIITDTIAHIYSFNGCTTTLYSPANSLTVPGTRTIFGLITVKNGANWDCYINWTPGYQ